MLLSIQKCKPYLRKEQCTQKQKDSFQYSSVIGYGPDPVENLSTYIQYSKPENTENLLSDPGTITICDHHSSTKTQTEFLNTPFRGNDCEMQDQNTSKKNQETGKTGCKHLSTHASL